MSPTSDVSGADRADQAQANTFWERVAGTRWGCYITEVQREALLVAHLRVGQPTEALEIGCEGGRWTEMLANLGWEVICTDIDREALEFCQRRVPSACCVPVSAGDRRLPAGQDSVDLLAIIDVPLDGLDWVLQEGWRILRPGGQLVGTMQNRSSWRGAIVRVTERLRSDKGCYATTWGAWESAARDTGFDVVHRRGFCWMPFTRTSNSRLVDPAAKLEKLLGLDHCTAMSPWVAYVLEKP